MKKMLVCCFAFVLFVSMVVSADVQESQQSMVSIHTGKKVLVVYYSRTGNTQRVAEDLAKALNADLERLVDTKKRDGFIGSMGAGKDATFKKQTTLENLQFNPNNYDLVIVGSPVWSWSITPAIRTYLETYKESMKSFACYVTAGGTGINKIIPVIEKIMDKKALAYAGFNQKDLKNGDLYNAILAEFIRQLSDTQKDKTQ